MQYAEAEQQLRALAHLLTKNSEAEEYLSPSKHARSRALSSHQLAVACRLSLAEGKEEAAPAPHACGSAVAYVVFFLMPSAEAAGRLAAQAALLEVLDVGEAQVVDPGGDLARVVAGEVLGRVLRRHRGQQERPALLVDGLMVQRPCTRRGPGR